MLSKEASADNNVKKSEGLGELELSSKGKSSSGMHNAKLHLSQQQFTCEILYNNKFYNAERIESQNSISSRTSSARVGSISEVDQNKKRGMVLPFEPHSITFDDIRYAVDMPQVIML